MREQNLSGSFIVIEGADGAGTTTISKKLAENLGAHWTFEPTDNPVGNKIDQMISSGDYSPEATALAFASDRLLHLEEEVIPELEQGETVVSDRYVYSSLIYQPVMGADSDWVEEINREAIRPDLTIILDVSAETGMERVSGRGSESDIFENMSFQEEVVSRYRRMSDREDVVIVDSTQSEEEVYEEVREIVKSKLGE